FIENIYSCIYSDLFPVYLPSLANATPDWIVKKNVISKKYLVSLAVNADE
ncbi:hypothetical protein L9F63_025186, partial [Diploptera punctata]